MAKYKKMIPIKDDTLILFNQVKSKMLLADNTIKSLTDDTVIRAVLKKYLGD